MENKGCLSIQFVFLLYFQMKDRVSKFEKFIQENEAKRRRAIQKFQQEVKLREQKALEFSSLYDQMQHYKNRLVEINISFNAAICYVLGHS